jgi:peptidoglycan hydrolase-like protein with peptidoglycan-binding domain
VKVRGVQTNLTYFWLDNLVESHRRIKQVWNECAALAGESVDGIFGPLTRAAIRGFQQDIGPRRLVTSRPTKPIA